MLEGMISSKEAIAQRITTIPPYVKRIVRF
jgi:hypothetical protein